MSKPKPKKDANRYAVERYVDRVLSGKHPSGKLEKLALQRHQRDLKNGKARGLYFDWDIAGHSCDWFPLLRHPKGQAAGKPFELVDAQKTVVSLLYGWRRLDTGLRRFREGYYSVARGNGKSPFAAAVALKAMAADDPLEPGAEIICAATTRTQAQKYVWSQARDFIRALPSLSKRCHILKAQSLIEFDVAGLTTTFGPLGSDSNNLDGGNYHCAIVDELHAFREQHRGLIEVISTAMGKRRQDMLLFITTAGSDRSIIWREIYDYAQKVLHDIVTADSYFAYVFACDPEDDPFDERNWIKANPLLGVSVELDSFRAMAAKAKVSPEKLNELRRYKLNLLVSSREKAFLPEVWALGNTPLSDLTGRPCHGAVDLGWRDDLAAAALCFEIDDGDGRPRYEFLVKAWIPSDTGRDLTVEPWRSLIADGTLEVTEGDVTDDRAIVAWILDAQSQYQLQTFAADPNNARMLLNELQNQHGIPTYDFLQTCRSYNEPVRSLLDLLAQRRVAHAGNKLAAWCADNVILKKDHNAYVMPDKQKSIEKIDVTVTMLMALAGCLFAPEDYTPQARLLA